MERRATSRNVSFEMAVTFGSKKFEISEYLTKYLLLCSMQLGLSCCYHLFRRESTSGAHHEAEETELHHFPRFVPQLFVLTHA